MKLIGYWIRSLADDEYPPPQEFVIDYEANVLNALANYLDAGKTFRVYRGHSWCRFFCNHPMGSCELTDGQWVWPQDLSHYVRDHCVALPNEFVQHVLARESGVSALEGEWSQVRPDDSFWISWCAKHRSRALESKIQSALNSANAEAEQIRVATIKEREISDGISEATCQVASCNYRALIGRALCANCLLETELSWRLKGPYMNLRSVLNG